MLGMRLVKKTVNQDDVTRLSSVLRRRKGQPRHRPDVLRLAGRAASERGTRSVSRTALACRRREARSAYWRDRLKQKRRSDIGDVVEVDGRLTLPFEDFEGQRLVLVDDGGKGSASPWERSPVPADHQIRGLGPSC